MAHFYMSYYDYMSSIELIECHIVILLTRVLNKYRYPCILLLYSIISWYLINIIFFLLIYF